MTGRVLTVLGLAAAGLWVLFFAPFSILGTVSLAMIYALVAISLVILIGWVGQISLAQASFVGIGAFTVGVVIRSFGLDFPLTILVGALVGAGSAALLGLVALRVRGLFLAVATLIFAWATQAYLFNLPWLAGVGGSSIAETKPLGEEGNIPYLEFGDRRTFYVLMLAMLAAVLLGAANLRDSRTGRAWFAVKGSEIAAASLGIDVTSTKLGAFGLSGGIAGLAGALIMTHAGVVSPTQFTVQESLFFLAITVVGGLTSLPGAVAAGGLFASLEELSIRFVVLEGMLLIVSAALLGVVLLFFPGGLAAIPARLAELGRAVGRAVARAARAVWRSPVARPVQALYAMVAGRSAADADEDAPADAEADEKDEKAEEAEKATKDEKADDDWRPPLTWRVLVWLWRGLLRIVSATVGRLTSSRKAKRAAPDALAAAVRESTVQEAAVARKTRSELTYVRDTATKIDLPPREEREVLLEASNITVRFGGLTAVNEFELDVRRGEIVGLIGPNGAGKTTLFNAISGLNQPDTGRVSIYGRDVSDLPVHERAQLGVARTFQVIQLFPERTVFENLMVATHLRNPSGFFANLAATPGGVGWEAASRQRVRKVIELADIGDVAHAQVANLPFGVLRLVELARALVTGSPLVMLDEPASGLDNAETDRFMDFLLWVRQSLGVTMLLIEHDMRVAMGLSDYLYVIDRGNQIAHGPPAEMQRNEDVIAAYLGEAPAEEDIVDDGGADAVADEGADGDDDDDADDSEEAAAAATGAS